MKSTKHEIQSTKWFGKTHHPESIEGQIQNSNDKNSKRLRFRVFNLNIVSDFDIRIFFKRGLSLVEIVVAVAILFMALTGLVTAYNMFVRAGAANLKTIQATYLMEEGIEAVLSMRDFGWSANIASLTAGNNYYLSWNGSRFVATSTVLTIDNTFNRYFTLNNVNRDSADAIVASGGTVDAGTKKLSVYVSWQNGATTTSKTVSTYITNLFNN